MEGLMSVATAARRASGSHAEERHIVALSAPVVTSEHPRCTGVLHNARGTFAAVGISARRFAVSSPARWLVVLGTGLLVVCGGAGAKPDASGAAGRGATDGASDEPVGDGGREISEARDADGDASDGATGCSPACGPGKECVLGACLSAPTTVAAMPACGTAHLALANATLYWTEHATGAVKSLATASPGASPTVVASAQAMPGPLAVDAANVYWANDGDMKIVKAALGGAAPAPLLTAPAVVSGLVASAGTVYYGAGPSTYKIAPADTTPTTLATFTSCRSTRTGALALDVDHLYQTDYLLQYLSRERIDGMQMGNDPCAADPTTAPKIDAPDTISHSQGELLEDALTVVGGQVVWADSSNINGKPSDSTTATGALTLATSACANAVTGFVVSGPSVYLAESGAAGPSGDALEIAPLDPGDAGTSTATVLAAAHGAASQLVADDAHVYWIATTPSATTGAADDCAIVSLAK
jgi:hypothetical protein